MVECWTYDRKVTGSNLTLGDLYQRLLSVQSLRGRLVHGRLHCVSKKGPNLKRLGSKRIYYAMLWHCIHDLAASVEVQLMVIETEISAALWTVEARAGLSFYKTFLPKKHVCDWLTVQFIFRS